MEKAKKNKSKASVNERKERRQQWWKEHKGQLKDKEETEDKPIESSKGFISKVKIPAEKKTTKHKKKQVQSTKSKDDSSSDSDFDDTTCITQFKKPKLELEEKHDGHNKIELVNKHRVAKKPRKNTDEHESKKDKKPSKQKLYVVFVGNLPFDVTEDEIRQHFIKTGGVERIRLLTNKTTGKSRGCGYVEFADQRSHKFALRLHNSELKGRPINVEFTAPGRGKSEKRSQKLKQKNQSLARFKVRRNVGPTPGPTKK